MRYQILLLSVLLVAFGPATAENESAISDAGIAAASWLELADQEKYQETWSNASSLFQMAITSEDWVRAVNAARGPLENLVSRTLDSAEFYRELPGAPDGEYVVLTFDSVFARKAKAVETVTVMRDGDAWRVSGYFIR